MYLARLTCQSFRCLEDTDFRPGPAINVVRGGNAQGKTSLLESVLFAATARSHRTSVERELVRHGAEGFRLHAWVRRSDRDISIEVAWHHGVKRFRVNGVAQTRVSDVLGKLNVVLFSPEDIALVKGAASCRRHFLDLSLSQVDAVYLNALQRYRQALRQRNELLRSRQPDAALLEVWDAQLAEHGGVLIRARSALLEELSGLAAPTHAHIATGEALRLEYRPDVCSQAAFLDSLGRNRDADIRQRVTTRGPHRDDFLFLIAERPAKSFASQGQQRTAALALKLAELELVKHRTGEYPVLLLDEVFSELDTRRAGSLFSVVDKGVQCLVTTTGLSPAIEMSKTTCASFVISGGRLEED